MFALFLISETNKLMDSFQFKSKSLAIEAAKKVEMPGIKVNVISPSGKLVYGTKI